MKRLRVAAGVLGALLFVVALTAVGGGVGSAFADALVSVLGNDYLVATAVAVLALLVAVPVALSARSSALDQTELPDPEASLSMPYPGNEFDEALDATVLFVPHVDATRRDALRASLRETAAAVVARESSVTRTTAADRVANGTWTDDDVAAAFLADDVESNAGRLPGDVGARLRALANGDSRFQRRARRTASVVTDHARGEERCTDHHEEPHSDRERHQTARGRGGQRVDDGPAGGRRPTEVER